jgi:hypothetical protein
MRRLKTWNEISMLEHKLILHTPIEHIKDILGGRGGNLVISSYSLGKQAQSSSIWSIMQITFLNTLLNIYYGWKVDVVWMNYIHYGWNMDDHGWNPSMIDELNDDQWISLIMEWKARAFMNEISFSE